MSTCEILRSLCACCVPGAASYRKRASCHWRCIVRQGKVQAKMDSFNLVLGNRKYLGGGGNSEEKTRETLTLGVTTGELQFPFLLPSLLGSWHPWAQVTTSLGISLEPSFLFDGAAWWGPSGRAATQSLSVCIHRGLDKGASEKELATSPAVAKRIWMGEGGLFPVREGSGWNSECTEGDCPLGSVWSRDEHVQCLCPLTSCLWKHCLQMASVVGTLSIAECTGSARLCGYGQYSSLLCMHDSSMMHMIGNKVGQWAEMTGTQQSVWHLRLPPNLCPIPCMTSLPFCPYLFSALGCPPTTLLKF